ncbi:MAG: radical SAM protein [Gammaproteobacteria bacterium]|jgi:radical SAM protein with 4Fe4S-binding SPASM domain|nr:radical SAM protein [Gammaproteobacteria bacterium]MBT5747292.1 radical SAM protein [Gammaproteobacteria bacterium]
MNDLFLLAINLTRRCNLNCSHCYLDAETLQHGTEDELTTQEVKQLLDEVAGRSTDTMVVLTGGEPLIRKDLEQLVQHGTQRGLSIVIGTNGVLLTEKRVLSLKAAGAMGAGISVDSLDPTIHDQFRGCSGSWEKTLAGMDACRKHELPFQVHFSITKGNAAELEGMIDFTLSVGAHLLNIFFLICTGRGEKMSDITPEQYEIALTRIIEAQQKHPELMIRARCAPHYKRIAYQNDPNSSVTRAEGYEGGGCIAGTHYCRITPEGAVTACPYIPDEEGSIRQQPFLEIWDHAPTFEQLRNPTLGGKCGQCEYQILCGGCRARPKALGDDLMDTDPWCSYHPQGNAVIQPLADTPQGEIHWTPEAQQRLTRVPGFLRKMVKKRAEKHVAEQKQTTVTSEVLTELSSKRFGSNMPKRPHSPPAKEIHLVWTTEAQQRLEDTPHFLREGVRAVAEDVAHTEGRLEVNIQLLDRLENEDESGRKLNWSTEAEQLLEAFLAERQPQVVLFVKPTLESAAEREAKRRSAITVEAVDMQSIIDTQLAGVEWDADALQRVEGSPEFNRAGIKKAAEFNARREGLARITSEDLTRFRNRAMMKAVRRLRGFGMDELNFDAYEVAKQKVPRLKDNPQAEKRFSEIRSHVEQHQGEEGEGLGVLDRELLDQMRAELKKPHTNRNKS